MYKEKSEIVRKKACMIYEKFKVNYVFFLIIM
jgi:hypothetical protein